MESESVNFDELLVKALAEFEKTQTNPDAPTRKAEYKGYAAYLQDMSDDDEELSKSEAEADRDSDNLGFKKGMPSDGTGGRPKPEWYQKRETRKVEITRMAFDQKILPLSEKIPIERKRLLVEILTESPRNLLKRYDSFIHTRVTKLLMPAIPKEVRLAAAKWPWMFIPNPGFSYQTSDKFGPVRTYWVYPKVPCYFKPGTEQEVLKERDTELVPYFLDGIDRAIEKWYATRDRLNEQEVMIATQLLKLRGDTYYHLLSQKPFWFEKLYNHIKSQQENDDGHSSNPDSPNLCDVRSDAPSR